MFPNFISFSNENRPRSQWGRTGSAGGQQSVTGRRGIPGSVVARRKGWPKPGRVRPGPVPSLATRPVKSHTSVADKRRSPSAVAAHLQSRPILELSCAAVIVVTPKLVALLLKANVSEGKVDRQAVQDVFSHSHRH